MFKKMKISFLIIILFLLTSCTLIGKEIDDKAEKRSGELNDRSAENQGFAIDAQIIEALVTGKKKEKHIDRVEPIVCKEVGERQICTATKGCWCEKT